MTCAKCSNCANACLLNLPNRACLENIFCAKWIEVVPAEHGCIDFISLSDAQYCHIQDFKTRAINKFNYPLTEDLNLNK